MPVRMVPSKVPVKVPLDESFWEFFIVILPVTLKPSWVRIFLRYLDRGRLKLRCYLD